MINFLLTRWKFKNDSFDIGLQFFSFDDHKSGIILYRQMIDYFLKINFFPAHLLEMIPYIIAGHSENIHFLIIYGINPFLVMPYLDQDFLSHIFRFLRYFDIFDYKVIDTSSILTYHFIHLYHILNTIAKCRFDVSNPTDGRSSSTNIRIVSYIFKNN